VYSLKFGKITNYTNIPDIAINKYITSNQDAHIRIQPFELNGLIKIREALDKIKKMGIVLEDEGDINTLCDLLNKK
jgi:predicted transcriptional regulator